MAGAVNKIKGLKVFIGVLIQCQVLSIKLKKGVLIQCQVLSIKLKIGVLIKCKELLIKVFKKVVIGCSHKHKALVNKIEVLEVMMGGFRKQ